MTAWKAHVNCIFVYITNDRREIKIVIMESLKEIQQFLSPETPQHLKSIAITYVLSKIVVNISEREQKFVKIFILIRFDWFKGGSRITLQMQRNSNGSQAISGRPRCNSIQGVPVMLSEFIG